MKEKIVGLGVLISASVASICCLGPIVLVGLGLGGAGLAAGMAKYRPLFLALTAVILAAAFYLTYRKRKVACADGTCELRSGSKTMKAALWTITALALGLAFFPHWSAYLLGKSSFVASSNAQTAVLNISGMTCTACAVSIEKSLKKVPGVQSAMVDFDKSEAVVAVDPSQISEALLIQAVGAAGNYTAEIKKLN